ncbi:DUF1852 family protein [Pseudomonas sp. RW3S2]|nr:DUF1852 family protein [Pseudomonas sp. RW3S2]
MLEDCSPLELISTISTMDTFQKMFQSSIPVSWDLRQSLASFRHWKYLVAMHLISVSESFASSSHF